MNAISRRNALTAAAAGSLLTAATIARAQSGDPVPQPQRPGHGGTDPGPRNLARDRENPDILVPPATDHGTLPNLRFSFSDSHMRLETGGWTRQVTSRELGVSKNIAGVNMRLNAGGVRELHWHKAAEWAYMLYGTARITAIDAQGRNFIDDVGVGDSASFFGHTPDPSERYIFPAPVPGPLAADKIAGAVPVAQSFSFRLMEQQPIKTKSGTARIVDSSTFPVSKTIAAALVEVDPGGMREPHWHPNTDEWQYYIEGQARMGVFGASGQARTFDFRAGDVGFVPFAMGHYVENTSDMPLRFLEMFKSSYFADVSLNQWMALTPSELVEAHLKLDRQVMDALRKTKAPVVPA
jgi:oxalate decarboxylase